MEQTVQTAGQQPVISTGGVDIDVLQEWHKEYMAADVDDLVPESLIILAVDSDYIDASYIESQIQHAMSTTHVSRGYCSNCQYLFSHWPDLGTMTWSHAVGRPCRTSELEAAARNGCKSCTFMLLRLKAAGLLNTFHKIERRLSLLNDTATASISISNWQTDNPQLVWLNFPGKVAKDCNSPSCARRTNFVTHVVSPSANCYEDPVDNFDIANKWLRTCSECHKSCRSKNELRRPSRLVYIANDVKLVLTADWETFPKYATLSYCWGREDFIKLTPDNLDSFLNIIPHEDLPKTLKDGIYIARRLGLEYVWIDALCIIQGQDRNDDWQVESGRMRFVYGSAHVNIAASSATNVYEGCFSKPTNYIGGFLARVTTSEFCRVQNFHSQQVYEESTIITHLASRAWTFQEKLLAPRTIYFGDRGMFWECRSMITSEFCPDWIQHSRSLKLVCPEGEAWSWWHIVATYSKANLTVSSDKLPALSGVARRQHEATGDEYLAGMWRKGLSSLTKQLGWVPLSKTKRPDWRAPTWSWTSIDAEIIYWPFNDRVAKNEYVQVLDARTTPAGLDPFGAISGGELQLRCTAMVRQQYYEPGNAEDVESDDSEGGRAMVDAKTQNFPIAMDCVDDDFVKGGSIYLLPLHGDESGMSKQIKENEGSEEGGNKEVPKLMIRGLVLQHSGAIKGRFRRVGLFVFRHPPWNHPESKRDCYHEFLQVMEQVGASTAESECAEIVSNAVHPESRYVITIE